MCNNDIVFKELTLMTRHHESRELILVGGRPGSGATWLAEEAVRQERHAGRTAECVPVGQTIRNKIGGLALASSYADDVLAHLHSERSHEALSPEIISGIVHETAYRYDGVDTLVIEGFPRTLSQLPDLDKLINNSERYPVGMLNAVTSEQTALHRLALRTDERRLTLDQQQAYMSQYDQASPGVRIALLRRRIMIEDVDTNGQEDELENDRLVSVTIAQTVLGQLRSLRAELREIEKIEQDLAA
jgi:adenylate kinase family enzyme